MKTKPFRQVLAIVSLLVFVLSGQAGAFGLVLCLGDDGHAALEYAFGDACGEGPRERSGERAPGLSAEDEHCGSCLDLDPSLHAASTRPRDHQEFPLQLPLPAAWQASTVPAFVRIQTAQLYPQPPPRANQTLISLRTVVLLN